MTKLSYFRLGCSPDSSGQVALYHPFFDRLLLVLPGNSAVIRDIVRLASSRYPLFMVDISTAPQYTPQLIDNTCCDAWTVTMHNRDWSRMYYLNTHTEIVSPIPQVQPAQTLSTEWQDFSIAEEKSWLQTLWFWLEFLQQADVHISPYQDVHKFLSFQEWPADFQSPAEVEFDQLSCSIHKLLYLATNAMSADSAIRELVAACSVPVQQLLHKYDTQFLKDQTNENSMC